MPISIYTVDAFTSQAFEGNPAGVCILHEPGDEGWMQSIAAEMNLSETAFVCPTAEGFSLRWFTPTQGVSLGALGALAVHYCGSTMNRQDAKVAKTDRDSGRSLQNSEEVGVG